jgi:dTDP-4-amino-4,6-dideoxygalactose transaminase
MAALRHEPAALAQRRAAEAWYLTQLADIPALLFTAPPNRDTSGALRLPVRLDPKVARTLAAYGVARSYPRTLDAYPPIREAMVGAPVPIPGSRELADCVHTLPTHALLNDAMRARLIRELRALLGAASGASAAP